MLTVLYLFMLSAWRTMLYGHWTCEKDKTRCPMKGTLTSEMHVFVRNKMKDMAGKLNSQDHKSLQDKEWASKAGAQRGLCFTL